jgi:hypothetical protein
VQPTASQWRVNSHACLSTTDTLLVSTGGLNRQWCSWVCAPPPSPQDTTQRWTFALDISGTQKTAFLGYLRSACGLPDVQLADLRSLMPTLSQEACAIAGQAAALSQWHLVGGQ